MGLRFTFFLCTLVLLSAACSAQTFSTLIDIPPVDGSPSGPLLQAADGNFYFETSSNIFKLTPSGILTLLYHAQAGFAGGLIQGSDGTFYGTAQQGGQSGLGAVFKLTPAGTYSVLYSFSGKANEGTGPNSGVIQGSDGNFYGVTQGGGVGIGYGTAFRLTPQGALTTLYSFGTSSTDGELPQGRLVQGPDGSLYGVCRLGLNGQPGTIWKISPQGVFTLLYTFSASAKTDGASPFGLIQGSDGNLYGTTFAGGVAGFGTIFKITLSGSFSVIYNLGSGSKEQGLGGAPLVQASDGNLYGTTVGGNGLLGEVFRVSHTGAFAVLHSFGFSDGTGTQLGMIQASDGNLYGVTGTATITFGGTVFQVFLTPNAPAPKIATGGIGPIYSNVSTIQPGEWISIYGSNLASTTTVWNGDFPLELASTNVTINGRSAYLWYVSPNQINAQAPDDTATGTVPVVVTTPGGVATSTVTLAKVAPSFNLLDSKHITGIILRSDNSGAFGGGTYDVIGPTGNSLGYPTVAAKAGDTVELFGVGFGPTKTAVPAGASFVGAAATTNALTVYVNNVAVTPTFSGETGAGLYQINLTLPGGLGIGDLPIQAVVGGVQTPSGVVIALQ